MTKHYLSKSFYSKEDIIMKMLKLKQQKLTTIMFYTTVKTVFD